jgi:hypothetical protein
MAYGYLTFGNMKAALLQRLQDTYSTYTTSAGAGFVTPTEAGLYLTEALRTLNAQAAIWNANVLLDFGAPDTWQSLNFSGSPRFRTVTDVQLYTLMQYHLLEPPSGGTWTGSTQFNITSMSQALQYRRDELMQVSGANTVSFQQPSPTGGIHTTLPDNILNLRRVRWVPISDGGIPYSLWREDDESVDAYGNQLGITVANPESWLITANAPLSFDCSSIPPVPGQWDMLAIESGVTFASPAFATVLGLPDDWCWAAKWGALADLLSNSPEGVDQLRAKYCSQRFEAAKKAMVILPWLIDATFQGLPIDTPSFEEADAYAQSWEFFGAGSELNLVVGGMDLVACCPFAAFFGFGGGPFGGGPFGGLTLPASFVLTVVGNAPIPATDGAFVQLSRDGVDAVLAYAQHLAMFKCGGAEFLATMPLLDQFERYCRSENSRYAALGIQRNEMIHEGSRGQYIDPRYQEVSGAA